MVEMKHTAVVVNHPLFWDKFFELEELGYSNLGGCLFLYQDSIVMILWPTYKEVPIYYG